MELKLIGNEISISNIGEILNTWKDIPDSRSSVKGAVMSWEQN